MAADPGSYIAALDGLAVARPISGLDMEQILGASVTSTANTVTATGSTMGLQGICAKRSSASRGDNVYLCAPKVPLQG